MQSLAYIDEHFATNEADDPAFTVREEFVGFVGMDDVSAQAISAQILKRICELGLDVKNCVGQGYDGASTMSGHISGVQFGFVNRLRWQSMFTVLVTA